MCYPAHHIHNRTFTNNNVELLRSTRFNVINLSSFFSRQNDTWWCRLLIAIWQYFITANYSWILMEGLYLHNLIFRALFTDSSAITLYVLLGWGELPHLRGHLQRLFDHNIVCSPGNGGSFRIFLSRCDFIYT